MPVFKLTPPTDTETNTSPLTDILDTEDSDEMVVVLDGPLSKVYTEALNKVYAIESYMADGAISEGTDDEDQINHKYIYAVDAEDLDNEGVNESFKHLKLALDSHKYSNIILAVENISTVTTRISHLDSFSRENDISIVYSRDNAIGSL